MEPVPLPPPFKGMNQDVPIITVQSPQCEYLFNFNADEAGISLRHGDSKYDSFSTPSGGIVTCFANYGQTRLFAVMFSNATGTMVVYDCESGALVYNTAIAGVVYYTTFQFRNYLFFLSQGIPGSPGFYFDGAAFGVIGYTATSFLASRGGTAYKNRAYIIKEATAAYWYSGVSLISGPVTEVDLGSIITEKADLAIITPITLADTVSAVNLLAFVFTSGEVLFYSGSYPDATDWQLVGKAKISPPVSYVDSYLNYQGDCLVFCDDGIYSIRDLFLKGSENARSLLISSPVEVSWKQATATIRSLFPSIPVNIHGIFDPIKNRLVVKFNYYDNGTGVAQGTAFFFVFNTSLQSWYLHRSTGMEATTPASPTFGLVYYKRKSLYINWAPTSTSTFLVWDKEGSTGFQDTKYDDSGSNNYTYEVISAPISNGRNYVQRVGGMDVILESDLYPQTEYKFIRDLGVSETNAQLIPTQASTLQKPTANMGIEGSFIQYKISGTTAAGKTVGYNLYGTNIWIENGSRPR